MRELRRAPQARIELASTWRRTGNNSDSHGWIRALLGARDRDGIVLAGTVVLVGTVLRALMAMLLSPHIDEPSSLLEAQTVADRGFPILPSGTVYLQGATLSYLLQPLMWLGQGDLEDLRVMRLLVTAASAVSILLCFRLGAMLTGDFRVGAAMATLAALDPLSVQWGGFLRMYGLLQPMTLGLALAYIAFLTGKRGIRQIAAVAGQFWIAVFTHVGATLLWPAMLVAAVAVQGHTFVRSRATAGCLALCAAAPATLMLVNTLFGSSGERSGGQGERSPLTFVGDNLLAPFARYQAGMRDWDRSALVRPSNLVWLVPALIVAGATIVVGRRLQRRCAASGMDAIDRTGAITLLAFYWVPIISIGLFTVAP